jgi:hypothetical protein
MSARWKRVMVLAPLAMVGVALFAFIGGEIVKQLWNWLLPPLFGWRELTFWQALGTLVLCRILFGGFGRHGSGGAFTRRRVEERFARMTPEERERIRESWRGRFGFGPAADEHKES